MNCSRISAATAIGREIARFAEPHPESHVARVNALRAGDGLTIARALGRALSVRSVSGQEDVEEDTTTGLSGFVLHMHPSEENVTARLVGRHLLDISEKRRAGATAIPRDDRWILESYDVGGIPLPRLLWRRCRDGMPSQPGHLAVAFDTFESTLVVMPENPTAAARPLEAYGLFAPVSRNFTFAPTPRWETTLCPNVEGLKHPASRVLSDRLTEVHRRVMKQVAKHLGGDEVSWPVLCTEITGDRADGLRRLHELDDWVLTVDRIAGLEYFDSPRENPEVYDTYVIDSVPEREDLDSVRLVTYTCQLDELKRLLDDALSEMGLSASPRNCHFLLTSLEAVSGRLAMRLVNTGTSRNEPIAVALLSEICSRCEADSQWLSLTKGFFVPLDDVRDLLFPDGLSEQERMGSDSEERIPGNYNRCFHDSSSFQCLYNCARRCIPLSL